MLLYQSSFALLGKSTHSDNGFDSNIRVNSVGDEVAATISEIPKNILNATYVHSINHQSHLYFTFAI